MAKLNILVKLLFVSTSPQCLNYPVTYRIPLSLFSFLHISETEFQNDKLILVLFKYMKTYLFSVHNAIFVNKIV